MNPVLYIVVRVDMASITPGRAAAQASHCASQLAYFMENKEHRLYKAYREWLSEADGFGTAIVLKTENSETLSRLCNEFDSEHEKTTEYNILIDPEYHIKDGNAVHLVKNVPTCFWVFGDRDEIIKSVNIGALSLL